MSLRALYDLQAPAKINLFLHVIGRRADGYHLLQSAFLLIDWADTLHFELRADGRLARHDLAAPLPADDLCLRAARALQAESGTSCGADISIVKQVPWGAGLGGGSSDAATTLLALNRLWKLRWPRVRLARLALALGADVPFFVGGENAFVEGIGERLTPLDLPPAFYAVVKPAASIATAAIFGDPALIRATEAVIVKGSPEKAGHGGSVCLAIHDAGDFLQGFGRNDLQPVAEDACPDVKQAAGWLRHRFGNSRMSGSGSAVFARVGTAAPPAAFPAEQLLPGWSGRMCRSLARHPLAGWAG